VNTWIRTTDTGRHRACYRDPSGATRSKTFDRKGDAKGWLAQQTVSIQEGTHVDPRLGRVKFGEFFGKFLEGSEIRPSTRDRYERHGRLYLMPAVLQPAPLLDHPDRG
jgi:hypothetical protein